MNKIQINFKFYIIIKNYKVKLFFKDILKLSFLIEIYVSEFLINDNNDIRFIFCPNNKSNFYLNRINFFSKNYTDK